MHPIHRTVEQVYIWRMRACKVMVRLLQQRQHALSAIGAPKAMYTNDAHLQSLCFMPGQDTCAWGPLPPCCPGAPACRFVEELPNQLSRRVWANPSSWDLCLCKNIKPIRSTLLTERCPWLICSDVHTLSLVLTTLIFFHSICLDCSG